MRSARSVTQHEIERCIEQITRLLNVPYKSKKVEHNKQNVHRAFHLETFTVKYIYNICSLHVKLIHQKGLGVFLLLIKFNSFCNIFNITKS